MFFLTPDNLKLKNYKLKIINYNPFKIQQFRFQTEYNKTVLNFEVSQFNNLKWKVIEIELSQIFDVQNYTTYPAIKIFEVENYIIYPAIFLLWF